MIYRTLLLAPLLIGPACSDSGFIGGNSSRSSSYNNDESTDGPGSGNQLPGGWIDEDGDGIYTNDQGDEKLDWKTDSEISPDGSNDGENPENSEDEGGNTPPGDNPGDNPGDGDDNKKITGSFTQEALYPVDYLFVVDNSSSMNSIITKLKTGFASIAEDADFPENAKIGVISTAVPQVSNTKAKIVGYKKLVTSQQIANSDRSSGSKANHPGCDGWFDPQQRDAAGAYCLESAIDFNLVATYYEAGLSSLYNFLKGRHQKKDFFRDGAMVNVIFVSDTHDPGRGDDTAKSLLNQAKAFTVKQFLDETRKKAEVDSIKYHGIVPIKGQGKCGSESVVDHEYTYDKFITGTGGSIEQCGKSDYSQFVTDMVKNSKFKTKLFKLPADFSGDITDVQIAGETVGYDHYKNQNAVLIKDIPSDLSKVVVDIYYQ